MTKPNVILTGFMGTGKSTVGPLVAAQMGYRFVDTDTLIEARQGRSIAQIFREAGEQAFREMEAAVARELAGEEGMVIATGGRLMLDAENAALLSRNGRVFCLTAEPEEILDRLAGDERRPLLNTPDPAARVRHLLAKRAEGYGRFTQISTSQKTAEQVAEEIVQCLAR